MERTLTTSYSPEQFLRTLDAGLSERRLLDEIGKLSCDELSAVLVMWHRNQTESARVAN